MTKIDTLLELYSDEVKYILDTPTETSEQFFDALSQNLAYLKNITDDIHNTRREAAAFHSRIVGAIAYRNQLGIKEQFSDPELVQAHSELEIALDKYININTDKRDVLYGRR